MTREEAIKRLDMGFPASIEEGKKYRQAVDMAISALSEELSEDGTLTVHVKDGSRVKRVFVMGDNIFGGLYYPDSAENKTPMIDKSNFDPEQYKADLQSAYDCGYNKALSENKGDLISKEQANAKLKAICERMNFEYNDKYGEGTSGYAFVHAFDDIPSADNKGEWIHVIDSYYEDGTQKESHWECSKCGSGRSGWGEFKFCPDCGADMRGKG